VLQIQAATELQQIRAATELQQIRALLLLHDMRLQRLATRAATELQQSCNRAATKLIRALLHDMRLQRLVTRHRRFSLYLLYWYKSTNTD
jgi:hypothetical protein